jgi:two-component system cell cycle response regulator
MINKCKPAIVISDIMMPEMDGLQLCKNVKTNERSRNIPIILLTALSDPEDVLKGLECGADNFMTKPYAEESLLAAIHHSLDNKEIRKDSKIQSEVEILFRGRKYFITSERHQILDFLLSTY